MKEKRPRLRIGELYFYCPLCPRTWDRGGHKEGFVKAAAFRHVFACWEISLFNRGLAVWNATKGSGFQHSIRKISTLPLDYQRKLAKSIRDVKRKHAIARAVDEKVAETIRRVFGGRRRR